MKDSSFEFFNKSLQKVIAKNSVLPVLNGEDLIDAHPASVRIYFGMAGGTNAVWNGSHTEIVFTHGMGCFPIVKVYDSDMSLQYPIVSLVDKYSVKCTFDAPVSIGNGDEWCCVISYGSEYGGVTDVQDAVGVAASLAQTNRNMAVDAKEIAEQHAVDAGGYASQTQQAYLRLADIASENELPTVVPAEQKAVFGNCVMDLEDDVLHLRWSDPAPINEAYGSVVLWKKTTAVANGSHMPTSISDGTVVGVSTVRNEHESTAVDVELVNDGIYIRLFVESFNGTVVTTNPVQRHFLKVEINDLDDFMTELRNGNIDGVSTMYPVGSTLPFIEHSEFGDTQFIVVGYDYKGAYNRLTDFLNESGNESMDGGSKRYHDVILVADTALSNPDGSVLTIPYDLNELTSVQTIDEVFSETKTYYYDEACTQVFDKTTVQEGDTPVGLGLYVKGRVDGSNRGYGRYTMSFVKQYLTSDGNAGEWYVPNSTLEPASSTFSDTHDGFIKGFDAKTKTYLHRCHIKFAMYGDSPLYVWDKCFLGNREMFSISTETFGNKTDYYGRMTSMSQRIARSVNGSAVFAFTGDCTNSVSTVVVVRNNSGNFTTTNNLQSLGQSGMVPFICLA